MATITLGRIRVVKTLTGGPPALMRFEEAASQTFKDGALVFLSGGYIQECGADPAQILGVVVGDGDNDATAGTSQKLVYVADASTVFEANVSTSQVTAQTDVGRSWGLVKVGNNWHIDKNDGTNQRVYILNLSLRDTVGDTQGRLLFQVLGKYRQLTTTS